MFGAAVIILAVVSCILIGAATTVACNVTTETNYAIWPGLITFVVLNGAIVGAAFLIYAWFATWMPA